MSDTTIGGDGGASNIFQSGEITFIPTDGNVTFAFINGSSISASDQTVNTEYPPSNSPQLGRPTYLAIAIQFNNATHIIISAILDGWNKSIQDEAQRIKDELNSPSYRAWQEAHSSQALAKAERDKPEEQKIATKGATDLQAFITSLPIDAMFNYLNLDDRYIFLTGLSAVLTLTIQNAEGARTTNDNSIGLTSGPQAPNIAGFDPAQFTTAALIIGGGAFALVGAVDVSSTSQVESRVIIDAWNSINPGANDPATQIGGWFSAMWGVGLVYQLAAAGVAEYGAGKGNAPQRDLEFAKNYASELINSINNPAFNNSMLAMITTAIQASPESKDQDPQTLMLKGKVILLALALALVAKLDLKVGEYEGHVGELDFAGLLNGSTNLAENDPHGIANTVNLLRGSINALLQQLSGDDRVEILENLLAYFSTDHSVENMLDQQVVFNEVLNPPSFEENSFGERPIR